MLSKRREAARAAAIEVLILMRSSAGFRRRALFCHQRVKRGRGHIINRQNGDLRLLLFTTAAAGMAHVRFFWAVLEAFTTEQRRLFLKFIWGRNRLPLTEDDWGDQRMKIHTLDKANPDAYFPVVHTCFFSIELPKYTSRDVCYKQLLWAINNCQSIDADNTRESRQNAAVNAFSTFSGI